MNLNSNIIPVSMFWEAYCKMPRINKRFFEMHKKDNTLQIKDLFCGHIRSHLVKLDRLKLEKHGEHLFV